MDADAALSPADVPPEVPAEVPVELPAEGLYDAHGMHLVYRPRTNDAEILDEVIEKDCYRLAAEPLPPDALVVDIGAHLGAFAALAVARGGAGTRVVAVELDPENHALLARNAADVPAIVALHAAVIGRHAPTGYVLVEGNTGGHRLTWTDDATGLQPVSAAVTLASLLAAHARGHERVALLKIDCEGSEHAILRQAAADGVLARVDRIAGEYHDFFGDTPDSLAALLGAHGFATELVPICAHSGLFFARPRPAGLKLHLGCGRRILPGWCNVDVVDLPGLDLRCAVDRMPMLADGSADVAYASHILEHFQRRDVPRVLAEWRRVLRPGGTLRIAVPDFAALCDLYRETGRLDLVIGPLFGRGDYLYNLHYNAFDLATLRRELEAAGFVDVRPYDWRATEHAELDDYSQSYWPHMDKAHGRLLSLNVEATRGA